jgi:hypothetical protein
MSYATEAAEISREPIELLVLTLDYCANAFGVAPCTAVGECCYNTYKTCKDKTNFTKTTKDYKFTSSKNATPFKTGELPYLMQADYLPCEIKDTITVNSRINVKLIDELWPDVGTDPYLSTRSAATTSTYWKMLIARNPNYVGRIAKLYRGFAGLAEVDFEQRFVGKIKNISYDKGSVSIELVDLLKSLDDIQIAQKVNLELVADIDDTITYCTLSNHTATGLSETGGVIRIDDELITYTALNLLNNVASGMTRGSFGTTAASHNAEAQVQPCRYYSSANPFDVLLEMLQTDATIDNAYIDLTAFADVKAHPGNELNISTVVSEPTSLSELFWEIVKVFDCKVWIDENLKITIAHNISNMPGRTYHTITDESNIVKDSISVDNNDSMRITRLSLYWDWNLIDSLSDIASYEHASITIDGDAESANEYASSIPDSIYSRWFNDYFMTDEEQLRINYITSRYVSHRRDALPIISFKTELKDYAVKVGEFAKITTDQISDQSGITESDVLCMITSKKHTSNGLIEFKAQRMPKRKVLIIAPSSYSALTYATASVAQREYGCLSDSSNLMSDGTDGYTIY